MGFPPCPFFLVGVHVYKIVVQLFGRLYFHHARSGTGSDPTAVLSPTSLDFGDANVGSSSSPQTVTLTNNGTADLIITNFTTSGDFSQTNTCGTDLAIGASCSIMVVFSPTAAGQRTGALTVTDNDPTGSQVAALSGNGVP